MNIIYKTIVGSHAYGTNIETSDTDFKGVYLQPNDEILSFRYKEQVDINKDETYYEVKRFLELAATGNPTLLEMLYLSEGSSATQWVTPPWFIIHKEREKFLTKRCQNSFGGFAVQQIKKAKGLDKKMNWEMNRVTRKDVLDFCLVHVDGKSVPVKQWLKSNNLLQENCGLVALDKMRDLHTVYYDYVPHYGKGNRNLVTLGFKGIVGENSNDVRLSSVPKGMIPLTVLSFNKDAYSQHCKDFREYEEWLAKRNTQRYVDVDNHGQKIDGKNMLHCRRLIDCGLEIAQEGTLTVKRKNADYLLKIRRGEVPLQQIIEEAERDLVIMDEAFAKSSLPEEVSWDFLNELILEVRHYGKK